MRRFVLAVVLVSFTQEGPADHECAVDLLSSFVRANLASLDSIVETSDYGKRTRTADLLRAILEDLAPETPAVRVRKLLSGLVDSCRYANGSRPVPLRDPVVVGCLVRALHHADPQVRILAMTFLEKHGTPELLRESPELVAEAWRHIPTPRFLRLVGLTDSEAARKLIDDIQENSEWPVPDEVLARLGDRRRTRAIMRRFELEENAEELCHLADLLAYVGTRETVEALASELRNPRIIDNGYYRVAVRFRLVRALARALPNEPLFGVELEEAISSVRAEADPERITTIQEQYYARVERWCEDSFGIVWESPRPPAFFEEIRRTPRPGIQ